MIKHRTLAIALAATLLAACGKPPAPPAPPSPPAPPVASANGDQSFIGRKAAEAIDKARAELATKNISISDGFDLDINGRRIHTGNGEGSNLPKAEITPQGDLLIEGKAVAVNETQRKQLLAYRTQIIGIANAGMTIGAQGADIAGHALSGVVGAIFGGKDGQDAYEKKIEAQAHKIEAEAMKLCLQLPAMLASQQALAGSLPEFKPYARMTQEDIDDCGKDIKGKGVAITAGNDDNG